MRHPVHIVRAAVAGAIVLGSAAPIGSQTPASSLTNWREVRSIKMGRFHSRIDVSSSRMIRLYSQLDTSRLTSQELASDSVRAWQKYMFSELDKPSRRQYTLGNAVLVQPFAADSVTIGYLLTVADTSGSSRSVVTDLDGIEEFLDMLAKGVAAATTLTETELRKLGPVEQTPITLAKHVNFVYPRTAKLAGMNGSAVVQFVVDTLGHARPESITCTQATYKDFADAAIAAVKTMEFVPASIEGHKIEQLVQYPIDFKLNAVLPVKPFEVPVRKGKR
ncbi:MAG TPA: TonB family protein [Gemmatimonadaceae bacterium]|nr:TonB family protein [Gemmatimonadaceae bacterium]